MPTFKFEMPKEIVDRLSSLGAHTDEIVGKALKAGGEVVAKELRAQTKAVLRTDKKHTNRQTGQLVSSIGVTKAAVSKGGDSMNIHVGWNEPRKGKQKTSNAQIASVIEHGKSGQTARPFVSKARAKSKNAAIEKMVAAFNEEASKL